MLSYATYLGSSGRDDGSGIAVDTEGHAYVTGSTTSPDFPTMHPVQPTLGGSEDAFIAKFAADGSALVYATYLGGSGDDFSNGIAVDANGHAYVTGFTTSPDFPTTHDALQPTYGGDLDAFVAKLATPLVECIEDCVGEFRDCVDSCQVGDRPGIRACTARFRACIDGCLP